MFGLGMPEILLILAIALIVIGPKKLPDLAKTLGRAMGEFKRSAQDFKRSIDVETTVKSSIKDIDPLEGADLKEVIKDVNTPEEKTSEAKEPEPDEKTSKPDASADTDSAEKADASFSSDNDTPAPK